jgi:drug/metabolite transporter superfamily protein YnfA
MTDDDKSWIKSLPLLLTAAILLIIGAYSFWAKGNNTLSIAVASVGVFVLGAWSSTAVADWSKTHRGSKGESNAG